MLNYKHIAVVAIMAPFSLSTGHADGTLFYEEFKEYDGVFYDRLVTDPVVPSIDQSSSYYLSVEIAVDALNGIDYQSGVDFKPIAIFGKKDSHDVEIFLKPQASEPHRLTIGHNRGNGGIYDSVTYPFIDMQGNSLVGQNVLVEVIYAHYTTPDDTDLVVRFDGNEQSAYPVIPNNGFNDVYSFRNPLNTSDKWRIGRIDHSQFGGVKFFKGTMRNLQIGTGEATLANLYLPSETCGGQPLTEFSNPGPGLYAGTSGDDVIRGSSSSDEIHAGGGNDIICGGGGGDVIHGGSGDDQIYGNGGADLIFAGRGADTIWGGSGNDTIYGQEGSDVIRGGAGNDRLYAIDDWFDEDSTGYPVADPDIEAGEENVIFGGIGDDYIVGSVGVETVRGGRGDDEIYGLGNYPSSDTDEEDDLRGGQGDDVICGVPKFDSDAEISGTLRGNLDFDVCIGGSSAIGCESSSVSDAADFKSDYCSLPEP